MTLNHEFRKLETLNLKIMNNFLYPIVNPKSVAFFGASNRFTAMGTNQLNVLQDLERIELIGPRGGQSVGSPKKSNTLGSDLTLTFER